MAAFQLATASHAHSMSIAIQKLQQVHENVEMYGGQTARARTQTLKPAAALCLSASSIFLRASL